MTSLEPEGSELEKINAAAGLATLRQLLSSVSAWDKDLVLPAGWEGRYHRSAARKTALIECMLIGFRPLTCLYHPRRIA